MDGKKVKGKAVRRKKSAECDGLRVNSTTLKPFQFATLALSGIVTSYIRRAFQVVSLGRKRGRYAFR